MKKLVLEFDDASMRSDFVAWFLDGGGEQGFDSFLEIHGKRSFVSRPPRGAQKGTWDWLTKGDGADEHVIHMKSVRR